LVSTDVDVDLDADLEGYLGDLVEALVQLGIPRAESVRRVQRAFEELATPGQALPSEEEIILHAMRA